MEKKKESMDTSQIKRSFGLAATSVTSLYQTSVKFQDEAYKKGKIDAFNEIVSCCLESTKGNIKNVSQQSFLDFLQKNIKEIEARIDQNTTTKRLSEITISSNKDNKSVGSMSISKKPNENDEMLIEAMEDNNPTSNIAGGNTVQSNLNQNFSQNTNNVESSQTFTYNPPKKAQEKFWESKWQ